MHGQHQPPSSLPSPPLPSGVGPAAPLASTGPCWLQSCLLHPAVDCKCSLVFPRIFLDYSRIPLPENDPEDEQSIGLPFCVALTSVLIHGVDTQTHPRVPTRVHTRQGPRPVPRDRGWSGQERGRGPSRHTARDTHSCPMAPPCPPTVTAGARHACPPPGPPPLPLTWNVFLPGLRVSAPEMFQPPLCPAAPRARPHQPSSSSPV